MVDIECGAYRQPCVACGRLNINPFEGGHVEDLAVGDAVEGHSARKTQRFLARTRMQGVQQVEQHLLKPRLERRGDILMPLLDGGAGLSRCTQPLFCIGRKEPTKRGRPIRLAPGYLGAVSVVDEIVESEREWGSVRRADDAAELIEMGGLAIVRQTPHLVLISILPEAEKLGERGVVEPL